jgi:hypothetical protein
LGRGGQLTAACHHREPHSRLLAPARPHRSRRLRCPHRPHAPPPLMPPSPCPSLALVALHRRHRLRKRPRRVCCGRCLERAPPPDRPSDDLPRYLRPTRVSIAIPVDADRVCRQTPASKTQLVAIERSAPPPLLQHKHTVVSRRILPASPVHTLLRKGNGTPTCEHLAMATRAARMRARTPRMMSGRGTAAAGMRGAGRLAASAVATACSAAHHAHDKRHHQ